MNRRRPDIYQLSNAILSTIVSDVLSEPSPYCKQAPGTLALVSRRLRDVAEPAHFAVGPPTDPPADQVTSFVQALDKSTVAQIHLNVNLATGVQWQTQDLERVVQALDKHSKRIYGLTIGVDDDQLQLRIYTPLLLHLADSLNSLVIRSPPAAAIQTSGHRPPALPLQLLGPQGEFSALTQCRHLEKLRIEGCTVEIEHLKGLIVSCPARRTVIIRDVHLVGRVRPLNSLPWKPLGSIQQLELSHFRFGEHIQLTDLLAIFDFTRIGDVFFACEDNSISIAGMLGKQGRRSIRRSGDKLEVYIAPFTAQTNYWDSRPGVVRTFKLLNTSPTSTPWINATVALLDDIGYLDLPSADLPAFARAAEGFKKAWDRAPVLQNLQMLVLRLTPHDLSNRDWLAAWKLSCPSLQKLTIMCTEWTTATTVSAATVREILALFNPGKLVYVKLVNLEVQRSEEDGLSQFRYLFQERWDKDKTLPLDQCL